ncbi:MAG: DUF3052 domain-containing protein [Acidimicrobiia bacterium]
MVGYSGTPLAKKMRIVEESRVLTIRAPDAFPSWLAPLPEGVQVSSRLRVADVVVAFCVTEQDLMRALPRATRAIGPTGTVWTAWPKKASGISSPLQKRETMMSVMEPSGLVDVKVGAISEVWSGLMWLVRRDLRDHWPPAGL